MTCPRAVHGLMVLLATAGCSVSAGSVNVGIWRPSRQVDTVVCVDRTGGGCLRKLEVGRDVPARSFGGGMFSLASPGYFHSARNAAPTDALALKNSFEYLRGRGGFALGGRIAANVALDFGKDERHTFFWLPVSVLGYWGYPAFDVYGGAGYTPYANIKTTRNDVSQLERRHGFQLLAGARFVLNNQRNFRISAGAELERQFFSGDSWTSVTGNLGLHL